MGSFVRVPTRSNTSFPHSLIRALASLHWFNQPSEHRKRSIGPSGREPPRRPIRRISKHGAPQPHF